MTKNFSTGSAVSLCHAPRSVSSPLIPPPHDGIHSITLNSIPSVLAHAGSAV